MAKREMKTYHSHQGSAFIMGIMCLLFVGTYALFLFMPAFDVTVDGVVHSYTGFDFLVVGAGQYIQMAIPDIDLSIVDEVLAYFDGSAGENIVVGVVSGFNAIISLVASILYALSMVLGVFLLILGLAWFIRGRITFPKFTGRFAVWAHSAFDAGFGVMFFYVYMISEIIKNANPDNFAAVNFMTYVVLGVQIAIHIIIRITHRLAYKNRVYEKKRTEKDEYEEFIANRAANNGQTPKKQGPVPVYEKDIPEGIRSIGDHAYANDDALTKANIPDGVTSLGGNAFANCHNLEIVTIPQTVIKIGANCFYNTPHLKTIRYNGTKEDWRSVRRGTNWLVGSGTATIVTNDGAIVVNPNQ